MKWENILLFLIFNLSSASLFDTIKSYEAFSYKAYFRSLPLQREGSFSGYTNLLSAKEERRGEVRFSKGVKKYLRKAIGDWEYSQEKKRWEKRPRGEDSDIMKILEILLMNNPQYQESLFTPNLVFLGSLQPENARGKILYRKKRVAEILSWDSSLGIHFHLKFSNHRRIRDVKIPIPAKMVVNFSLPDDIPRWRKRIEALDVDYDLTIKKGEGTLRFKEIVGERLLTILFAAGKFAIYQETIPLATGEKVKVSSSPLGLIFHLPEKRESREARANLSLLLDEKISFPLLVDKSEKEGRIEALKMEISGKERELLYLVLQEPLSRPIKFKRRL